MDTPHRRCRSEQLPTSRAMQLIAPHKVIMLRAAQLQQWTQDAGIAKQAANQPILPTLPTKVVNKPSSRSTTSPQIENPVAMKWCTTGQGQLDGSDHFPSPYTDVASSKDRDRGRARAETEFYEQTDDNGVVRRRSMLKAVDEDDCLVARGANPRTGLITPDTVSIADSLETSVFRATKPKGSLAQWKLDGDQGFSVHPKEQYQVTRLIPLLGQEIAKAAAPTIGSEPNYARPRAQNISPLTEPNLRPPSSRSPSMHPANEKTFPYSPQPGVHTIKRKPVDSPLRTTSFGPHLHTRPRCPSTQTVINSPTLYGASQKLPEEQNYFSPNDVGGESSYQSASDNPTQIQSREPFLGRRQKPHTRGPVQAGGFNPRNLERCRLQQFLQTSSGPCPLPLSDRGATPTMKDQNLLELHTLARPRWRLPSSQEPSSHQGPTAYPLHSMRELDRAKESNSAHIMEQSSKDSDRGPICTTKNVNRALRKLARHREHRDTAARHTFNTTYTAMSISTSRERRRHHPLCHSEEKWLPKQNVSPGCLVETPCNTDKLFVERQQHHHHDGFEENISPPVIKSPRRYRIDRSPNPRTRHQETITALQPQSNLIGTRDEQLGDEEESSARVEHGENKPRYATATGTPHEVMHSKTPGVHESGDTNSSDHSYCCPECCIKYDCHEGCQGHESSTASLNLSAASNLDHQRRLDAKLQTSVEAVNQVFLEPEHKPDENLSKLMSALSTGSRSRTSPQTKFHNKQAPLKRTMGGHAAQSRASRPVITGASDLDSKQAVAAAMHMMHAKQKGRKSRVDTNPPGTGSKFRKTDHCTHVHDHASGQNPISDLKVEHDRTGLATEFLETKRPNDESISTLSRISALVCRSSTRWTYFDSSAALATHIQELIDKLTRMTMLVLDTSAVISAMVFEFRNSGTLSLPEDVNMADFAGNCLRSLLYIMIGACVYASMVKISRIVLALLRVILFPLRLCAWSVG